MVGLLESGLEPGLPVKQDMRGVGRCVLAMVGTGVALAAELTGQLPAGAAVPWFLLILAIQFQMATEEIDWIRGDELGSTLGAWTVDVEAIGAVVPWWGTCAVDVGGRTFLVAEGVLPYVRQRLGERLGLGAVAPRKRDAAAVARFALSVPAALALPLAAVRFGIAPEVMCIVAGAIVTIAVLLYREAAHFLSSEFDELGFGHGAERVLWTEIDVVKRGALFPWRLSVRVGRRWHVLNLMFDARRAASLRAIFVHARPS